MPPTTSNGTSSVQIVVSAIDKASGVIGGITTSATSLSKTVTSSVQPSLISLGAAVVSVFGNLKGSFLEFFQVIEAVDSLLQKFANTTIKEVVTSQIDGLVDSLSNAADSSLTEVFNSVADTAELANGRVGQQFKGMAAAINTSLGGVPANIANTFDRAFLRVQQAVQGNIERVRTLGNSIASLVEPISGVSEAVEFFSSMKNVASQVVGSIGNIVQEISVFTSTFGALRQVVATGPYQLLIEQNAQLQQQLLATKASLVGTTKILENGIEIKDPKAAIAALDGPINAAIERIKKGSLKLVGVTSNQLIDSFQIVSGQIGQIGGSLEQASDLTLSFAAAMGTLGIPLFQARQEITSILTGTIDMNSVMAKSLNITNEQVRKWKSQGTVFQELTKRLSAFRDGNELAAQTISGYTSNIQEIIDEIGRQAGKDLLAPIVARLKQVYEYLESSQESLIEFATAISKQIFEALDNVADAFGQVFNSTKEIAGNTTSMLFDAISAGLNGFANAIRTAVAVLSPFLELMGGLSGIGQLINPLFQVWIQTKVLTTAFSGATGALNGFINAVPGAGELLFLMGIRSNSLVGLFTNLTKTVGSGGAGFLLLGKNLASLPPVMNAIASQFGMFGGLVTSAIPFISKLGIGIVALAQKFPIVAAFLRDIQRMLPGLLSQLAMFVARFGESGAIASQRLNELAFQVSQVKDQAALATKANSAFSGVLGSQLIPMIKQVISSTLIYGGGLYLLTMAVNKFILENEKLKEILGAVARFVSALGEGLVNFLGNPMLLVTGAVGALGFALSAGLLPALLKTSIVMKANVAAAALKASASLLGMAAAAKGLGLAEVAAGLSRMAMSIGGMSAAATGGTLTLGGFATALWGVAAGALAAAAPFAILAAGIAAIGMIRYTKDIKDSTEATEEYSKQTAQLGNQALRVAGKLKAAKELQAEADRKGLKLTDEQYAANKRLQKVAQGEIGAIKDKIAVLQEAKKEAIGDENKNALQTQIAELTRLQSVLEANASNVQIQAKELPRVGTAYEQLADKARSAQEALDPKKSSGDPAVYKQKAEELIEITQQQVKEGQISQAEAVKRYELIATNVNLDKDTQIKAQQAITEVQKVEGDRRIENIQAQQSQIQSLVESGKVGETEGERRLTASKKQELEAQLENLRQAQAQEDKIRNDSLAKDMEQSDKDMEQARQALLAAEAGGDKKAIQSAAATLNQITQKRKDLRNAYDAAAAEGDRKYANSKAQIDSQISENEAKERNRQKSERIKDFDEVQTGLDAQLSRRLISEQAYSEKSLQNTRNRVTEELKQIENQRKKLDPSDKEGLQALAAKEAAARKKLADETEKVEQKKRQTRLQDFDEERTALDSHLAQKLISEEEYAEKSLDLVRRKAAEELKQIQEQRAKLAPNDKEGAEALAAKENEVRQKLAEEAEKFEQRKAQIRIQSFDNQQKILEGKFAQGLTNEQEYNDQSLKITQDKLNAELDEIARQRSRLKSTDKAGLDALAAQEAEVRQKQVQALEEFQQRQLAIVERAQRKAADELQLSETQRLTNLQTMFNKQQITEAEFDQQKVNLTGDRIKQEIELERQKIATLQSLPQSSDPRKEEERQAQIRQSRIKTAQLTQNLVENEAAKQEAAFKLFQEKIARSMKAVENAIAGENLELEKQGRLQDMVSQGLDAQNRLLEARKSLSQSLANYALGELNILSELSKSEREKKQLAETAAAIKLRALQQQQNLERQSLELQIKQNKAALEREKIQLRIQQLQNKGDLAQAKADLAIAQANPKARPEEIEAARLKLQAKVETDEALQQQGVLLEQKGQEQAQDANLQRFTQGRDQQLAQDQARLEYTNAIVNPRDRRRAKEALDRDIRLRNFGTADPRANSTAINGFNQGALADAFPGQFSQPYDRGNLNFSTTTPQGYDAAKLPPLATPTQQLVGGKMDQGFEKVVGAVARLEQQISQSAGVKIEAPVNVTNNLMGAKAQDAAKQTEQTVINANYNALKRYEQVFSAK